jgi:hypothetical protein
MSLHKRSTVLMDGWDKETVMKPMKIPMKLTPKTALKLTPAIAAKIRAKANKVGK